MSAPSVPIAKATFRPWGNSLALRFPTEVLKMAGFSEGVEIGFYVTDEGVVVLRPLYPAADDQEGLRALFLTLRGSAKSDTDGVEEEECEPMGDERI